MVTAKDYEKRSLKGQQEWALCHCKNLITRGNNSDNYMYTESMINIFKSVVLQRKRASNFIELFKFITEDLQMYFQRKLFALAFGKSLSGSLVFGATAFTVQLHIIKQTTSDCCKFSSSLSMSLSSKSLL